MSFIDVPYVHGDLALTGKLAVPAGKPRAAVLVFPSIANGGARIDKTLTDLAAAGYVAMRADFYGFVPDNFEGSFAHGMPLLGDRPLYRARCAAAEAALRARPEAAGLRVAAIGYCMGGTAALELARAGHDLAVAVSFHGGLTTEAPAAPGGIKARILVCHGDADPMIDHTQVLGFWDEMNASQANWHFHCYAGVKHGFTDPEADAQGMDFLGFNSSADRQSWAATLSLFDEVFG